MMAGTPFRIPPVGAMRRICGSPRFALFYMAALLGSGPSQKESRASVASQNSVFRINIAFATVSKPFPALSGVIQSILVF